MRVLCGTACEEPPGWVLNWASPRRLLTFLCALCLLFFIDRGVVASNGVNGTASGTSNEPGISTGFGLSLFEDGLVAALYYVKAKGIHVGVMLGAPAFAQLSKRHNALRLLGAGASIYALGALMCGFSYAFAMVLVFRCVVGFGTGSLIALGPPLIDDHSPAKTQTLWLGIFYLCMPTGVALGYLIGGAIGTGLTWRAAFWLEAGAAVPFALWCLLAPAVDIRRQPAGQEAAAAAEVQPESKPDEALLPGDDSDAAASKLEAATVAAAGSIDDVPAAEGGLVSGKHAPECSTGLAGALEVDAASKASSSGVEPGGGSRPAGALARAAAAAAELWADVRQLSRHPVCICVVFALACWNGLIGAYGYYGPKAVVELFGVSADAADFTFGAVLAASGILGSLAGGVILDMVGSSMTRGMLLASAGMVWGCVLAVLAVTLARTQAAFWPVFCLAQLGVFVVQAPANAVCMWSVPAAQRPFALSVSEVMQHLLGDIPSPPALGALQGAVDNWRLSLAVFGLLLAIGGAIFLLGALLARRARDYRQEEDAQQQQQLLAAAGPGEAADEGGAGSAGEEAGQAGQQEAALAAADGVALLTTRSSPDAEQV